MALYQPTNIYPNLLNGTEYGTVDASQSIDIQWNINGTNAMTGYVITIETLDGSSVYTITETLVTPVYGKDNLGNVVPFVHTITSPTSHGITNGNQYQFKIRQNWATGYVVQNSPAVFQTVYTPYFTASNYSTSTPSTYTITSRSHTFDFLTFSDVNLRWFRWILSQNTGTIASPVAGETIYDTGKVYGSGDMTMEYNGFDTIRVKDVVVQCIACDRNGREISSNLYGFVTDYISQTFEADVSVDALKTGSAIEVMWSGTSYIHGVATPPYSFVGNNLLLSGQGSSVVWDTVDDRAMLFNLPWIFVYKGQLRQASAILFNLSSESGTQDLSLEYDLNTRTLTLKRNTTSIDTHTPINYDSTITAILYADSDGAISYWLRVEYLTGGLYPSETLYPEETIYPSESTELVVDQYHPTISSSYTADNVSGISIYGIQTCYYAQLLEYSQIALDGIIEAAYDNDYYTPEASISAGVYFQTQFQDENFDAGSLSGFTNLSGWMIYRYTEGKTAVEVLGELPLWAKTFCDYAARTDGTMYVYEIAPIEAGTKISDGISTETPFGITGTNYSILECTYNTSTECYQVLAEYDFGKNVQTGDISNNNRPNILQNFTRYPTVQLSPQNYQSGTLTSMIGKIEITESGAVTYTDSRALRDAIFALSTSTNPLFLKTRKGDVLQIQIADAISMSTMDNTLDQALTATVSWVEVADASNASILTFAG